MGRSNNIIIIGGSAGSYNVVRNILSNISPNYPFPIVLCLHRLRDAKSGLADSLNTVSKIEVIEPDDKTRLEAGFVYLAPSNYHLLFENGDSIVLSVDEEVNFSRPSIDLTFDSAACNFKESMIGILLSGANSDGSDGLQHCYENGAYTIIQDPGDALFATMPKFALSKFRPQKVATEAEIIEIIRDTSFHLKTTNI